LGNGTIKKPENVKLIATWNNIAEIGYSHPRIKEQIDIVLVQKAAQAIIDYSDYIIEDDPFTFSANRIQPTLSLKTKSIKNILIDIAENGLPSENTYEEHSASYGVFMKIKEEFAEGTNAKKLEIRKGIFANTIEKNKFKVADNEQLDNHAYWTLLDVDNFLDKEHKLKIYFDDEADFRGSLESIKRMFELYIHVKQRFFKKWVLDKSMLVERNDFFDLLNLVYVDKGQYYWTKEKRWVTAIEEANMNKYKYN
jgi:hypothetical protein